MTLHERLRYRLLTGPDDAEFCARVSQLLDEGYELYGSPAITHDGSRAIVAQAVLLPPYEAVRFRSSTSSAPVNPAPAEPLPDAPEDPGPVPPSEE